MVKHTKNSSDSIKCTSPRHSQDKGWNFMDALSWWCLSSFFLSTYLTSPLSMLPPSLYWHQKKICGPAAKQVQQQESGTS